MWYSFETYLNAFSRARLELYKGVSITKEYYREGVTSLVP